MRKMPAALCCAVFSAAASGYYLHHHHFIKGKHYPPPAIAVNRTLDTLVIINLHAYRHPPLPIAAPSLLRQWANAQQVAPSAAALPWPGLNTDEKGSIMAHGATPGARSAPPVPASSSAASAMEVPDIGDGAAYAQLSLDRPCKTIAHCNWLGVRAIRDGVPQKAVRSFQTALELATQQHDQYMTLIGYHNLAMAYWWMKHYRQAAAWAEKGLFTPPPTALASDQEAPVAQD